MCAHICQIRRVILWGAVGGHSSFAVDLKNNNKDFFFSFNMLSAEHALWEVSKAAWGKHPAKLSLLSEEPEKAPLSWFTGRWDVDLPSQPSSQLLPQGQTSVSTAQEQRFRPPQTPYDNVVTASECFYGNRTQKVINQGWHFKHGGCSNVGEFLLSR